MNEFRELGGYLPVLLPSVGRRELLELGGGGRGALGHGDSAVQDSFSSEEGGRILDCPHYTRPRVWEGMEAPEILFSGDHGAVERWRREQAERRTRARRPDLLS